MPAYVLRYYFILDTSQCHCRKLDRTTVLSAGAIYYVQRCTICRLFLLYFLRGYNVSKGKPLSTGLIRGTYMCTDLRPESTPTAHLVLHVVSFQCPKVAFSIHTASPRTERGHGWAGLAQMALIIEDRRTRAQRSAGSRSPRQHTARTEGKTGVVVKGSRCQLPKYRVRYSRH